MATKIYLPSSGSPDVTPASWLFANVGTNNYTYKGITAKISSSFADRTEGTGTTSPFTEGVLRYVIGPLTAQTISGTVRMVMRVSESNAGANAQLRMAVKIIQSNGSDRATLLAETSSDSASSPYEMTTTLSTKRVWKADETEPPSLTSQDAQAGDYLVIEIGHRSATTVNRTITYNIGDNNANDLTYGDNETNIYCPWVEFSATIGFVTPPVEESASLAKYAGISALEQASVQDAVSQAKYLGISSLDQITMQEAASLGRSMGLSVLEEVGGGPTEESASLAKFVGITIGENQVIYESVTLSMSLGIAEGDQGQIQDGIILGATRGISEGNQCQIQDDITLGITREISEGDQCVVGEAISLSRSAGQGSGDLADIFETIALPRSDGLIAEGNLAGGAVEESVTLSRLAGLSAGANINLNESISLGYARGIGQVEQLIVSLSVSLEKLLGVSETDLGILYETITLENNRGIDGSSQVNIGANIVLAMIKTIQSQGTSGGKKQNKMTNIGLFLGIEEGMNT